MNYCLKAKGAVTLEKFHGPLSPVHGVSLCEAQLIQKQTEHQLKPSFLLVNTVTNFNPLGKSFGFIPSSQLHEILLK